MRPTIDRSRQWMLGGLIAVAVLLRLSLLPLPGNVSDISVLVYFGAQVATHGVHTLFDPAALSGFEQHFTYPPLIPAILAATFRLWVALGGATSADHEIGPDAVVPTYAVAAVMVKLLAITGDVAIGLLLHRWSTLSTSGFQRLVPTAAYLFSPGIVYTSAVWGQVDSLPVMCVLAGLLALAAGRATHSWLWLVAGALSKPQALVVGPVLMLWTLRRHTWKTVAGAAAAALLLGALATAPFWITGRGARFVATYTQAADAYPRVTVGAFNAWVAAESLIGTSLSGRADTDLAVSWLTFRHVGMLGFGVCVALLIARLARSTRPQTLMTSAAGTYFAFFMLLTQMHERYLYAVIPLLCAQLPRSADVLVIYFLTSFGFVLNLVHILPWSPEIGPALADMDLGPQQVAGLHVFAFVYYLAVTLLPFAHRPLPTIRSAALGVAVSLVAIGMASQLGPHQSFPVRPTLGHALAVGLMVFAPLRIVAELSPRFSSSHTPSGSAP